MNASLGLESGPHFARRAAAALTLALGLGLAACGGGGGGSSNPPAPTDLVVNGTAATGAALAGAAVELECASGNGAATTAADGSFSATIAGGVLPCVARVTSGNVTLHGLAYGSGASVRANITPATELVLARLLLGSPAGFFAAFDAARITTAAADAAQAAVKSYLTDAGVDFAAIGDLVSGPLVASTAGSAGDAHDQALEALAAALGSSGNTLAGLTTAMIEAGTGTVATLPASAVLRPAAPTCAAFRSGDFRILAPAGGSSLANQVSQLSFDAATLTGDRSDAGATSFAANGNCRFTETGAGFSADVVVSRAGILFGRRTLNGVARHFIGLPIQAHSLAELAGTWNVLGMNPAGAAFVAAAGTTTLNDQGRFTGGTNCQDNTTWALDVCVTVPDNLIAAIPTWTSGPDEGFATYENGAPANRLFAYRAGSGDLMLVAINFEGGFGFYAIDKSVPLPAVGTRASNWNLDSNSQWLPLGASLSETTNTVTANDTAAGSWTRLQRSIGSAAEYSTTLFANKPRRGYVFRAAATVTASNGATLQLNEFTFQRMHGMGFSPVVLPGPKTFELSIGQP
ncbi:hypothetical protein [Variovorax sp. YR752]|uniref:hypothetical protein n=1 Tax=Variovorax sp. YR752 TaxID=1884383 RepID=UPI003137A646